MGGDRGKPVTSSVFRDGKEDMDDDPDEKI